MKLFKQIALSAFLTASAFCAVFYTSCSKDACKDVTCDHGGTCSGGNCTCPTGYTGTNCETLAFIATWKGNDACTPTLTANNITITLASSSTDSTTVLISNAGGFADNTKGTLSSDGKTITYSNQIVNASSTTPDTLTGSIVLTDNTHFTHTYTASEGTIYSCTGNYTKQ